MQRENVVSLPLARTWSHIALSSNYNNHNQRDSKAATPAHCTAETAQGGTRTCSRHAATPGGRPSTRVTATSSRNLDLLLLLPSPALSLRNMGAGAAGDAGVHSRRVVTGGDRGAAPISAASQRAALGGRTQSCAAMRSEGSSRNECSAGRAQGTGACAQSRLVACTRLHPPPPLLLRAARSTWPLSITHQAMKHVRVTAAKPLRFTWGALGVKRVVWRSAGAVRLLRPPGPAVLCCGGPGAPRGHLAIAAVQHVG